MQNVEFTLSALISHFYQLGESDVDIVVSVSDGVQYAVGGERRAPIFKPLPCAIRTVDNDVLNSILTHCMSNDPEQNTAKIAPHCLTWLDAHPNNIIRSTFILPFKDKHVRIDYQALKLPNAQYYVSIRLTMHSKIPHALPF